MTTILIGVDDSPRSDDAVAFARPLAAASDAGVVLACAFPDDYVPTRGAGGELRDVLESAADETVRRAAAQLEGIDPARIRPVTVASFSPGRALGEIAESEHAELIVVGSTHTGPLGRIVPGSTAERLLHGAPCPVAVVPGGYRPRRGTPPRVGVAYDGSRESRAALHAATELARALGGRLRVIHVYDATSYASPALMGGPGYVVTPASIEQDVQEELERTVAELPADVHAEPVFCAGDPAHQLAGQSVGLDMLVAGSRGYSPLRAVLLGGVTGRLLREAACPLIVVPRGHETPLGALFGAQTADSGTSSVWAPRPAFVAR